MTETKTIIKKIEIVVAVTIIALIVYILSSGPAIYLVRHKVISEKVANFIYEPLDSLTDWHPYQAYVQWWYHTKAEREQMKAANSGK